MKTTTIGCALLSIMAFSACKKGPQAGVTTTTGPAAQQYVPPATPEPHLVSNQGTYFLLKRVSTETDSGVINFQPGTKLIKINDRYVTADGKRLSLRADQVTNKLQVAYVVAGRDAKLLGAILSATEAARAIQGTTPPAPAMKTSAPDESLTYAKPLDAARKNRN